MIFTIPIISKYSFILNWFYNIFIHSEHYGSGDKTIINFSIFISNLKSLIYSQPVFFIILLASIFICLISIFNTKIRKSIYKSLSFRLLVAITISQLIQIIMVAKHYANHYLIPAIGLSGLLLFLIFLYIYQLNIKKKYIKNYLVYIFASLLIILSLIRIFNLKNAHKNFINIKEELLIINQKVENEFEGYAKIYYYRSSSIKYALKFGDNWACRYNSKALEKIYSSAYFYNIWEKKYYTWENEITFDEIRANNKNILFQGTPFDKYYKNNPEFRPDILLNDILNEQNETIYTIDNSL